MLEYVAVYLNYIVVGTSILLYTTPTHPHTHPYTSWIKRTNDYTNLSPNSD